MSGTGDLTYDQLVAARAAAQCLRGCTVLTAAERASMGGILQRKSGRGLMLVEAISDRFGWDRPAD